MRSTLGRSLVTHFMSSPHRVRWLRRAPMTEVATLPARSSHRSDLPADRLRFPGGYIVKASNRVGPGPEANLPRLVRVVRGFDHRLAVQEAAEVIAHGLDA